jgi:lactoylglutathione lyase
MRLGYVILYVPDVAQAVAFYGRAFGLAHRFTHKSGAYAELETGKMAVMQATEAGAALVRDAERKPWGQVVAYIRDLNGVLVELCSPVEA